METMEAPTPFKPNASFEQQCSTKIAENSIEYVLNFGINGESIYFELYDSKNENYKYMNIFSLTALKKINFWFNQFSSLEKAIKIVKNIMNSNKFKIKEGNTSGKIIYFSNPLDEEDIISLELNKEEKSDKEIIKDLLKIVKELKEKNEFLENKVSNLEKKIDENNTRTLQRILMLEKQIKDMNIKREEPKTVLNENIMDSLIVSKMEDINLLKKWVSPNQNMKFELIYRATRYGDTVKDFHRMCDNKSPTLCIFKTPKNYIFGGYTNVLFNNPNNQFLKLKDSTAFVFSLNSKAKYLTKDSNSSVIIRDSYLIIFGNGRNSIQIEDKALSSRKHWSNPKGSYGDDLHLTEDKYFSVVEMEVFHVKIT